MTRSMLLQLCPFSAAMEAQLRETFEVCPYFELGDTAAWLADNGPAVRAVVTGGHIGIANDLMAQLPGLGIVAINGVGFDKVDLAYAQARGVRVTTTPDVLTDDVADLCIGLIISLLRGIAESDRYVRANQWPAGERPLTRKVSGKRFGIVGLGRIGSAIAARLTAFGPVSYTGRNDKQVAYRFVPDLYQLARESDVLILSGAANADTANMIDARILDGLGPDGYLVNVSRGSVVDEPALIRCLEEGRIAGAALDVFRTEPNVPEALRQQGRVVLTPHIASATVETRGAMAQLVIDNLRAFDDGRPLLTAII